jgi:hypothetical protein
LDGGLRARSHIIQLSGAESQGFEPWKNITAPGGFQDRSQRIGQPGFGFGGGFLSTDIRGSSDQGARYQR